MRFRCAVIAGALAGALACAGEVQHIVEKARAALAAHAYGDAAALLREAAALAGEGIGSPDALRREIRYNLAVCADKLGDKTGALAVARAWLAVDPADATMRELAAKLAYALGDYGAARADFLRLRVHGPVTPVLLRQIAQVEIARRAQDDALAAVAELRAADASAASLEVALEAYTLFARYEDAIRAAAALRSLAGDEARYRYAAGVAYARLGNAAGAERELAVVADDPVYGDDARLELGGVLAAQPARAEEAVAVFAGLLERDPYCAQACFRLSTLLFRLKRAEEADRLKQIYESLQASEQEFRRDRQFAAAGRSVEAALYRSRGYVRTRQYAKAEDVLRDALRERPGDETLVEALARLLAETERFAAARELAQALPSLGACELVGVCLRGEGRLGDALAHFTAHAATLGDVAWHHLGKIHLDEYGDAARARECLGKATGAGEALVFDRARAELAGGAVEAAERLLAELAAAARFDADALNLERAACALGRSDASAAGALLESVRGPLRGSARYFRVKTGILELAEDERVPQYRAMRDRIAALEDAARALRREAAARAWPQAAPTLVALARNAEERRQRQEAVRYAFLAVGADPRSAEALRVLCAYPLPDFVRLGALVTLAALDPADEAARAKILELRRRYGIASAK
jgi:hypothetical protein